MSKSKAKVETMPGADRDTTDAPTAGKKRPQPKQVIDPVTHQWRDESKSEKFARLGKHRTLQAEKRIRQLIALGNQKLYPSTEEQRHRILVRLSAALEAVERAFQGQKEPVEEFNL